MTALSLWETEEEPLARAIEFAEVALNICTGHDDYQRKKIAYYIVSTHFIPQFDPFPSLVIYGPPSTGKSMTLNVLRNTCWGAVSLTAETITPAALKDCLRKANLRTLIIEEADSITLRQLEETLITRYSRSSADDQKMIPDGKGWTRAEFLTFGATVVHRRNLFRNPALLRRVITVRTHRVKKEYSQLNRFSPVYKNFHKQLKINPTLSAVKNIWDVEAGIFDCYRPLIALATYLNDGSFIRQLVNEMKSASERLREEETYLEAPIFLKILIGLAYDKVQDNPTSERISIETRRISPALREEFGADCPALMLSANQRNRIIKEDLGFKVGASHGRSRIYLTIAQLIKVCDDYGIKDDLLEEWKAKLQGQKG